MTTNNATLEHVNITVSDALASAQMLCGLFDWEIRWQGQAIDGGFSVHVGNKQDYVAVYQRAGATGSVKFTGDSRRAAGFNHIGLVVDDLDATERRILDAGFTTENHGNYDPGRRFYFNDHDGIEYELVSYA